MTTLDRNSKADTVFLGLKDGGGPADMAVDQSQERDDLTDNTTYLQELSTSRFAVTYPRELSVCFTKKTGDTGILLQHGPDTGADWTYRMRISGNDLDCSENGNLVVSVSLPDVSGSDRRFMAHWSSRPDASDVRHELTVYNYDTDTWAHAFATSDPCTTDPTWDFNVGGYGAGTLAYDVLDIDTVRVGIRFHSQAEAREDWVDESTKPALDGVLRQAALPIATGNDVGTVGDFAGPAYLWTGADSRDADRRLISPIVNMRAPAEFAISKADHSASGRRNDFSPIYAAPQYLRTIEHVWRRPVPLTCNRVHARVYVRMWTIGDGPCEMFFRLYSLGNMYYRNAALAPGAVYHGATATQQTDDAVGDGGNWIDLGTCQVARDTSDPLFSTFCLAHSFDNGGAGSDVDDTRFAVLAVQIEPFYQPATSGNGFDIALP
jgi:hypothetical protein